MLWVEQKYIGFLSNRLRNFKRKSSNIYNFSCPICNDSKTYSRKARGYIYTKKGVTLYYCHNCGASMNIDKFISIVDKSLYLEYIKEKLFDSKKHSDFELDVFISKMKIPKFISNTPLKNLKKVSQLDQNHPCKEYINNRKIPTYVHCKLFWCPKFKEWTNSIIPNKFDSLENDEGRLIIPFINENGELHAYQGRSINSNNKIKYITIVINENIPKIYGLNSLNKKEKIYVFEGPLDSIFIPNSIATAGGDIVSSISFLPKDNIVIVYDNEPRSKETKKKLEKAIYAGYNVCIWPSNFEYKDINDAIMAGLTSEYIQDIINQNIFKDLRALIALKSWSKV